MLASKVRGGRLCDENIKIFSQTDQQRGMARITKIFFMRFPLGVQCIYAQQPT